MLAPCGCATPTIERAYLGQRFALVGTETSLRVPQGDAVDNLSRVGNAKQRMYLLFHLGMQSGNGATNTNSARRQQQILHRWNDRRRRFRPSTCSTEQDHDRGVANLIGHTHSRLPIAIGRRDILGAVYPLIAAFSPPGFMVELGELPPKGGILDHYEMPA